MTDFWDKIRNSTVGIRGLGLIGSANIIGSIISAVFWFYFASVLGTEKYGEVGYYISLASIIGVVCFFGAGKTLMVYRAKQIPIQSTVFLIGITLSLISATVLYAFLSNIGASMFVIGYTIFGIASGELLGTKLYRSYFNYFLIQRIALLPLAVGLYYIMGPEGVILGYGLSYFHLIIVVIRGFKQTKVNFTLFKERINFVSHNYITDLSASFSSNIDRIILAPVFGFALLGNYQLSIQVLAVMSMLPSVVFQYLLPRESSGVPSKKLRHLTIITAVGLAVVASTAGPIILPLFFPGFDEAIFLVQIVSFVLIPRTVSLMYTSKFLSEEKSKIVLISAGVFLGSLVSLIFLLKDPLGIVGAAIAILVSSSVQAGYLFAAYRKAKLTSFKK